MAGGDDRTLAFYAEHAAAYEGRQRNPLAEKLDRFLAGLPAGARILELGCGGGQDAGYMLSRGYDVVPTDGSPQMTAEAERLLQRPVKVLQFLDLDEIDAFDAVWASACLLHVPRGDLALILALIHRALRVNGRFWASFKAGSGAGRDALGRFYNYPDQAELRLCYEAAGSWAGLAVTSARGSGYDGNPTDWLWVEAGK